MKHDFGYLNDKILSAEFLDEPFRHIYIEDFFTGEHFQEIIESPQVTLNQARSDKELIKMLHDSGYEAIPFPGTTTDINQYTRWHKDRDRYAHTNVDTCEGFGVTMRLKYYQKASTLGQINAFFNSPNFISTLHKKFELDNTVTEPDNGLQKYLDGYEISPHPDVRKKALTYMINVNPSKLSEDLEFHTHYLRFTQEQDYVRRYWQGNQKSDRCWVPWEWCETIKTQRKNNSIVIFSPSDDTIHAIRATYDHLKTQRTQFYGNLWYYDCDITSKPNWRDFQISATPERPAHQNVKHLYLKAKYLLKRELKNILPASVIDRIRRRGI